MNDQSTTIRALVTRLLPVNKIIEALKNIPSNHIFLFHDKNGNSMNLQNEIFGFFTKNKLYNVHLIKTDFDDENEILQSFVTMNKIVKSGMFFIWFDDKSMPVSFIKTAFSFAFYNNGTIYSQNFNRECIFPIEPMSNDEMNILRLLDRKGEAGIRDIIQSIVNVERLKISRMLFKLDKMGLISRNKNKTISTITALGRKYSKIIEDAKELNFGVY